MSISWTLTYIFLTNTLYRPSPSQSLLLFRYKKHKKTSTTNLPAWLWPCLITLLIKGADAVLFSDIPLSQVLRATRTAPMQIVFGLHDGMPPESNQFRAGVIFDCNCCISAEKYLILSVLALFS